MHVDYGVENARKGIGLHIRFMFSTHCLFKLTALNLRPLGADEFQVID